MKPKQNLRTQSILIIALFIGSFAFSALSTTTVEAGASGSIRVLLFASDYPYNIDVTKDVLEDFSDFSTIDIYDYQQNTTVPSLSELLAYDVIAVWTDYPISSEAGDVISDYIDAGGAVVMLLFSDVSYYGVEGRYVSTAKNLLAHGGYNPGTHTLGTVEIPGHPIMDGVSSFTSTWIAEQTDTVNGGIVVARYSSNDILVAVSPSGNVVALNFWPGDFYSGVDNINGGRLLRNALVFAAKPSVLLFTYDYSESTGIVKSFLDGFDAFSYIGEYNYDVNDTLPSLSELLQYRAILVWTNFDIPDEAGDVISDYIDAGGAIVVMTFADTHPTDDWGLGGRYVSTGKNILAPMYPYYSTVHFELGVLGTVEVPGHPIMKDVVELSTDYNDPNFVTVNGGIIIATYDTGHIMVAVSPSGNVVALNFFPQFSWTGDGAELMRNALLFAARHGNIPLSPPTEGQKGEGIPAPVQQYTLTPGFTYASFVNVLASKVNAYLPEGVAITGIDIVSRRSFQNAQLLVDETNENPIYPAPVPLEGVQVYKYEKVLLGIPKASITEVEFAFKVDLAWLSAMGVVKGEIVMFQFNGAEWVELPTTMLYEDSNFAYYSSVSVGLGYLAIAG